MDQELAVPCMGMAAHSLARLQNFDERANSWHNDTLIGPSSVWASGNDWLVQKASIEQLYVGQNLTLKDVMEIMLREYNFKATISMYKKRIAKWGIEKRVRRIGVEGARGKKITRNRICKKSSLGVAGRAVDGTGFVSNLSRKQVFASGSLLPYAVNSPATIIGIPPIVPRSPMPPDGLRTAEEMIVAVKYLVCGSFGMGRWCESISDSRQGSGYYANTVHGPADTFLQYSMSAIELSRSRDRFLDAEKSVSCTFDSIGNLLMAESIYTLVWILRVLLALWTSGHRYFSNILLAKLAMMSRVVYKSSNHPLRRILSHLRNSDVQIMRTMKDAFADETEQHFGAFHRESVFWRLLSIQMSDMEADPGSKISKLRNLLRICDQSLGQSHELSIIVLKKTASVFLGLKLFKESEFCYADAIHRSSDSPNSLDSWVPVAGCYLGLSISQYCQHKSEEAASNSRKGMSMFINMLGEHDPKTKREMAKMETCLAKLGKFEEAAQIRRKRHDIENHVINVLQ